jgi:hypothetical protein
MNLNSNPGIRVRPTESIGRVLSYHYGKTYKLNIPGSLNQMGQNSRLVSLFALPFEPFFPFCFRASGHFLDGVLLVEDDLCAVLALSLRHNLLAEDDLCAVLALCLRLYTIASRK